MYVVNDMVSHGGSSYVAVAPNIDQQPGVGASWNLLAGQGAAGPPGVACELGTVEAGSVFVQQCASYQFVCEGNTPCPVDFSLVATCPAGYIRLSLVNCKEPSSNRVVDGVYVENIATTSYFDPYDNTKIGCRYTGFVSNQGKNDETFEMRILCIKEADLPCLVQ